MICGINKMLLKDNSLTAEYICYIINASINTESVRTVRVDCKISIISSSSDIF